MKKFIAGCCDAGLSNKPPLLVEVPVAGAVGAPEKLVAVLPKSKVGVALKVEPVLLLVVPKAGNEAVAKLLLGCEGCEGGKLLVALFVLAPNALPKTLPVDGLFENAGCDWEKGLELSVLAALPVPKLNEEVEAEGAKALPILCVYMSDNARIFVARARCANVCASLRSAGKDA